MKVIFVHGVPETSRVWDDLRAQLDVESMALQLPGFGVPVPEGFVPDKDGYVAWLVDELRRFDEPVNLVGHDWGALLALRVATLGEVELRSWAVDVAGVFHPDYEWHPYAVSLWEPGTGEQVLAARRDAAPDDPNGSIAFQVSLGVPLEAAVRMAAAHDELMSRCILGLYRSARPNVGADWGDALTGPTVAPGLVLTATADAVENEQWSREVADRLDARVERLDGMGHWWMFDRSGRVADVLRDFWRSVDGRTQ
ncbi:alpha/beta fold hydrolase [Micromonospora sp. NPDC050417]|uniref:alpha/beta fold hydrolase n=1 Tax=Micromonospora sp. NPDC050417 TaxID=3364280 RepID=UPI003793418F